jgi:hypothetical protein
MSPTIDPKITFDTRVTTGVLIASGRRDGMPNGRQSVPGWL